MIFNLIKSFVPESYSNSRDYRVFLRQLGVLLSVFKYNIDHFPDLYSADSCPDNLLPLLASMVGYEYSDNRTIDGNRSVIKYFPLLIRNRGSKLGIKLAAALSCNTLSYVDSYNSMNLIYVDVNFEDGVITVYYPFINIDDVKDIPFDLLERVRPVGMRIDFKPSMIKGSREELDFKVTAKGTSINKYYSQSVVDNSNVGMDTNADTRIENGGDEV